MKNYFTNFIYFLEQNPMTQGLNQSSLQTPSPDLAQQAIPGPSKSKLLSQNQMQSQPKQPEEAMVGFEEPLDFTDIGKIYVLKKVYVKLLSIDNLLKNYTDEKYIKLKSDTDEAIDMFHTVVSNIDKVKENLDDYIKLFQDYTLNSIKKIDSLSNKED